MKSMKPSSDLSIEGMSCQHCVQRVRNTLEGLDGVEVQDVEIGSARIGLEPDRTSMDQVKEALREAGFEPA
jgi:copper chaperone